MGDWTFFSNYGHVLVCLARNPRARLRDVAQEVGITERAVQKIVKDMQAAGFLDVRKQGRCNRYRINRRKALRHGLESHCTVGKLLALIAAPGRGLPSAVADEAEEDLKATDAVEPAVPEPLPGGDRPVRSETESQAAPAPAAKPEHEPELHVERKPESKPDLKPEPKAKGKKKAKGGPLDIEQQGSLF